MIINKILSQKEITSISGGSYRCTCCNLFAQPEIDITAADIRSAQVFTNKREFLASKKPAGKIIGAATTVDASNDCFFC